MSHNQYSGLIDLEGFPIFYEPRTANPEKELFTTEGIALLPEKSFCECARITLESRLLGNFMSDFTAIGMLRESGSQIPYFHSQILTETTTKAWATHASEKEDLVIAAKEEVGTKDAKVRLSCKDPSASFRV